MTRASAAVESALEDSRIEAIARHRPLDIGRVEAES
jgi:hypothetical protein